MDHDGGGQVGGVGRDAHGVTELRGSAIDDLVAEFKARLSEHVLRREAVYRILAGLELVEVTPAILRGAGQPLPVPLGSLNAIHLATAELWRRVTGKEPLVATHDQALALAARAS